MFSYTYLDICAFAEVNKDVNRGRGIAAGAKESIEAAQNYRSELQQRLHGLSQARKQVRLWLSALLPEE